MLANTHALHCIQVYAFARLQIILNAKKQTAGFVVALALVIDAHTLRQSVASLMRILHMSDLVLETVGVCRSAVASSLTGTSGATVISNCSGHEATCYSTAQLGIVNKQQKK